VPRQEREPVQAGLPPPRRSSTPHDDSPALAAALTLCLSSTFADEGMWTFNNFPAAKVGQA
jgi:hypothetical protein